MPAQQGLAKNVAAVVRRGTGSMADKGKAGLGTYLVGDRKQAGSGGGAFREVPTPGYGVAHVMNERVYAKAARRATGKIREFAESQEDEAKRGGGKPSGDRVG